MGSFATLPRSRFLANFMLADDSSQSVGGLPEGFLSNDKRICREVDGLKGTWVKGNSHGIQTLIIGEYYGACSVLTY